METTAQTKPGLFNRFYQWLFSWRIIRRLLLAFIAFITLIAAFYTEENWRGKRAWEKCRAEMDANGEKLDMASFAPPAVPDGENFAMAPLLKPIFEYRHASNHVEWLNTNGLARLQKFSSATLEIKNEMLGNIEKGSLVNLDEIRSVLSANTNLAAVTTGVSNSAESILMSLQIFENDLKDLSAAAASRPRCHFPIEYSYDPPMAILLPHLANLKGLVRILQLRIVSELELGQTENALADLKLLSRLADATRDEPFLISHLVRLALTTYELQCIREGIARHAWTSQQLLQLEKRLGTLNMLAEYQHTMRGERAMNIAGLDYLRKQYWSIDLRDYYGETDAPATMGSAVQAMPSGWFYQNEVLIAEWHQQFTLEVVNADEHRVYPLLQRQMMKTINQTRVSPCNVFAKMLFPSLANAWFRSGHAQTRIDQTTVACALERYHQDRGEYPTSLQQLVDTQIISHIPNDIIDGQPLRYKRQQTGFILYSIGTDEKDDDGTIILKTGSTPGVDLHKGDWVWQMPNKTRE